MSSSYTLLMTNYRQSVCPRNVHEPPYIPNYVSQRITRTDPTLTHHLTYLNLTKSYSFIGRSTKVLCQNENAVHVRVFHVLDSYFFVRLTTSVKRKCKIDKETNIKYPIHL